MAMKISSKQVLGPKDFLASLRIERRPKHAVFTNRLWEDIKSKGGDPKTCHQGDGFEPAVGDMYFIDVSIARRVLSEDHERYVKHFKDFTDLKGFPSKPKAIAEIGCGAGIVALWLAHHHPEAHVIGFDWSARALEVARIFAADLKVSNVDFAQTAFEDIADAPPGKFDLVIAYHAFDMQRGKQVEGKVFAFAELSESDLEELSGQMMHAMRAVASLLSDTGVGVICGTWDEVGLVCLFHAIRRAGLGTNWSTTFWNGREQCRGGDEKHYIFVRKSIPHIGANAWEDGRALLTCGEYYGRNVELTDKLLESYVALFTPGETLAQVEFRYDFGGAERLRLLKRAGLLLFEHSTTLGFRRGLLHSMASIDEMAQIVLRYQAERNENGGGKFTKNETAERLMPYLLAAGALVKG
jgi:SAM-dependent methyltransferase